MYLLVSLSPCLLVSLSSPHPFTPSPAVFAFCILHFAFATPLHPQLLHSPHPFTPSPLHPFTYPQLLLSAFASGAVVSCVCVESGPASPTSWKAPQNAGCSCGSSTSTARWASRSAAAFDAPRRSAP